MLKEALGQLTSVIHGYILGYMVIYQVYGYHTTAIVPVK